MGGRGRVLLAIIGLVVGLSAGYYWFGTLQAVFRGPVGSPGPSGLALLLSLAGGGVGGAAIAYFLAPRLVREGLRAVDRAERRLAVLPVQDLLAGAAGVLVGLLMGLLIGPSLAKIPFAGDYLPSAASLLLGYLGGLLAVRRSADITQLFVGRRRRRGEGAGELASNPAGVKILDTSAIIDGRIADLCRTGFLEGPILVPSFVLDELRHIADSSDGLRRARGRRGLDILRAMRETGRLQVRIEPRSLAPDGEVDSALVELARELGGRVVTTDFNLNKVAQLHGVPVLNINDLANALKPAFLPGEEMAVHVIRDGKESGQGVAYLDDGTMVVVEGGKPYIGHSLEVEVTSVLQTSAGRLIFARPKDPAGARMARTL